MTAGLGIDLVVIPLLIATICFTVILNRRLENLRRTGAEFQNLMKSFQEAVATAENSIARLKSASGTGAESLTAGKSGVTALKDDLDFLVARGEVLAERLAEGTRAKHTPATADDPPRNVTRLTPAGGTAMPAAEGAGDRELLKALEGVR